MKKSTLISGAGFVLTVVSTFLPFSVIGSTTLRNGWADETSKISMTVIAIAAICVAISFSKKKWPNVFSLLLSLIPVMLFGVMSFFEDTSKAASVGIGIKLLFASSVLCLIGAIAGFFSDKAKQQQNG